MTIDWTDMKEVETQTRDKSQSACWEILKKQALEFCRETGLHGYKYISQTQRSKAERIVWLIMVIASLCCSIVLITMSWEFYSRYPTLTVIESTHHGIWHYPFPAITICDGNRMSYKLTKEFVDTLKIPANISKEYLVQEMRLMNELLVPGIFGYDVQKNLTRLQNIIDDNNLSIFDVINSVTKNCSTLLTLCKWKGTIGTCEKYFKQSLSRDGLCCSFNYHTSTEMPEDNMQRSAACGFESGMAVLIKTDPNDYHATLIGTLGAKIMIHYSYDYPDFNAAMQLVRLNTQQFLSISPTHMYSKDDVRRLAIPTRKCIFNDETPKVLYANGRQRNLTFARYSYHNCLAECRAGIARLKCGCIPYYFPQNDTRVCNLEDVNCLKKYNKYFDASWPDIDMKDSKDLLYEPSAIKKFPCGCITDCALYEYPMESSFGMLDPSIYYDAGSFSRTSRIGSNLENHSIVHVFFNDLVAFQYRRSVNYSWRNLFASFGGLLGLFAGFSLMSVFEIIYFFGIRVIIDVCMNSRKRNDVK